MEFLDINQKKGHGAINMKLQAWSIPSAFSTKVPKNTVGGVTVAVHVREMLAGVLIIIGLAIH